MVADPRAIAVAPGDAVRLGGDPRAWRVVRSDVEAMRVTLDLVPLIERVAARPADAGAVVATPDVVIARTIVEAFELYPDGEEAWSAPRIAIAAAGDGARWRGAAVEISRDDGASWETLGRIAAPTVIGRVTAPVARGSATLLDRAGVIELSLTDDAATLQSADAAARDRGANLALLGDEVIRFARVEQVAPARWRLSVLERGLNGSAASSHDIGARFVLLTRDSLLVPATGTVRLGDRVRVSARGVGDGDAPAVAETIVTGRSVAPLAPVHARWTGRADGSARVTWIRRSRLGWRWADGEVPLAEERESYRVEVASAAGTRVVLTPKPGVTITDAEVAGGGVRVSIAQVGTLAASRAVTIMQGSVEGNQ